MARTIIVGDVHGCSEELDALLDRVAFADGDHLVFVGDLIARGPNSLGVLAIARRTGATVVRGNHEEKLLVWRARAAGRSSVGRKRSSDSLGAMHLAVAEALSDADWALLEASQLWCSLTNHQTLVVHAGLMPGIPIEEQDEQTLLHIRAIDSQGQASEEKGKGSTWGEHYTGPPHVVFGHNALSTPQLHPWATGIDTGCVYGGRLTAMVLADGQPPPRGEDVGAWLVSEPARRVHYNWMRKHLNTLEEKLTS